MELDCFARTPFSRTHLVCNIDIFLAYDIIAGPLDLTIKSSTKLNVPEYQLVIKTFNFVEKMPR